MSLRRVNRTVRGYRFPRELDTSGVVTVGLPPFPATADWPAPGGGERAARIPALSPGRARRGGALRSIVGSVVLVVARVAQSGALQRR